MASGWPGQSFSNVYREVVWLLMTLSWFIGVVYLIIGLVMSSGQGGAPMGTIGTERPEDYPDPGLSKSYRGGSFAIAGALLLLVGTSVCFGNGWL